MAAIDIRFVLNNRDNWTIFIERLELFLTANDISDAKKVPELLTRISTETYSLIRNLVAPKKPGELSFAEIDKIVSNHLIPPTSELAQRHKFTQIHQNQNEKIKDFVARLKQASSECKFADLDTSLRDQFVNGIQNHKIRIELFKQV